ncbi:MAG: glycosyltransferase [Pseudomonadota bacterium]
MSLAALSLLVLAAWIALAATRLPILTPPPRLRQPAPQRASPSVAAVIPARNEEETIGAVIRAHFASDYPGALAVVIVDDHSTDETAARVIAASGGKMSLIEAPPLPAGWTGKLWAVNAGLAHVSEIAPNARYVLLADADIVFAPDTLRKLVAQAEETGAALTSLMARLDARGFWGGLLIPAFVYFFQKLYPFHDANDPGKPLAAAAGGCMLLRRDALDAIGGVEAIRGRLIDDCALAAAVKKSGRPVWIGLAKDEAISLRDNRSLASIWSMVARSAFAQLGHSWLLLIGTVACMIILYPAPTVIALAYPLHGDEIAAVIAAAAWTLMALTYLPTARVYDQAPWKAFFLPVAALLYTMMTIASAINHARGMGGQWKGRTYPA